MAMHPQLQKVAQEELDRVVGTERLPSFEDRDDLPYIETLIKETIRWHPPVPIGDIHVVSSKTVFLTSYCRNCSQSYRRRLLPRFVVLLTLKSSYYGLNFR